MNIPSVDYRALIEELRCRFLYQSQEPVGNSTDVLEDIRNRLACLLEAGPDASMQEIIDQLATKWHRDGLI